MPFGEPFGIERISFGHAPVIVDEAQAGDRHALRSPRCVEHRAALAVRHGDRNARTGHAAQKQIDGDSSTSTVARRASYCSEALRSKLGQ